MFSMAPEKAVDASGTVLYCCHYLSGLLNFIGESSRAKTVFLNFGIQGFLVQ